MTRLLRFASALPLPLLWAAFAAASALGAPTDRYGASAELKLPSQVWAGEVFDLSHRLSVPSKAFGSAASGVNWLPSGISLEPWSAAAKKTTGSGDDGVTMLETHTRGIAANPGAFDWKGSAQSITVVTGTAQFGNYVRKNYENDTVTSAPLQITVRALPPVPADAGVFTGAVGHFTLSSQVAPANPVAGKSFTWTVVFSGTGNWPSLQHLPPRSLPAHFRAGQTLSALKLKAGTRFDGSLTEDLVVTPEEPGKTVLSSLRWCYFDPQLEHYVTLTADASAVTVTPAAPVARPASSTGWPSGAGGDAEKPADAPSLPAPALRDPVPPLGNSRMPLSPATVRRTALGVVAMIFPVWLALAWLRMRRRDPLQPRRDAKRHALQLLTAIETTTEPARIRDLIERWQREIARLWALRPAAPTPASFGPAAEWERLWRESNRARFSASTHLPADWVARARAATSARCVPGLAHWAVLRPRHLLPLAAFVWIVLPLSASAADESALYRSGKFAAAEAEWRTAVAAAPQDAGLRHNLALALAQQGKVGEAAVQSAAAFVQCPNHPVLRWDLGVLWRKARFGTPEIVGFLNEGPLASWAQTASPAAWQRRIVVGTVIAVLGAIGLLGSYFGGAKPRPVAIAWTILGLGLAISLSSVTALRQFGDLAQPDAALVWRESPLRSVPTEVGGVQDSATLVPGTIVRIDDHFLTWSHLVLPNGQTGWLRDDASISLWK